ncbi:hypothetical protein FRC09_001364, partial [Ceratobasidium sp. 395]
MAKYNVHVRKSRSALQKAQMKEARERSLAVRSAKANNAPATDSRVPPYSPNCSRVKSDVLLQNNAKQLQMIKHAYENSLLREKRAKKKVNELQTTIKQSSKSLLGALEGQSNAQAALEDVQALANRSAQEAETLEKLVEQYSHELATAYSELEIQYCTVSGLKNRQTELYRSRDAMRKKIHRLISRNATVKTVANTPEVDLQTYQLKNKSGVIQPQVREMIRKLVCK